MKEGDLFFDLEKDWFTSDRYLVGYVKFNNGLIKRVMFEANLEAEIDIDGNNYDDFDDKKIFKVNRFPNKSDVRKNYNLQDKVYYLKLGYLKYGVISVLHMDNYYTMFENDDVVSGDTIIPSNWFILRKNCLSTIHETSKCLLRLRIYKDLRVLITKYIWESRNDEEWGY